MSSCKTRLAKLQDKASEAPLDMDQEVLDREKRMSQACTTCRPPESKKIEVPIRT